MLLDLILTISFHTIVLFELHWHRLEPLKLVEPRHFYWSDNANPGKSPFVYLCVISIAFVYFYDFPIGLDCVLFFVFVLFFILLTDMT